MSNDRNIHRRCTVTLCKACAAVNFAFGTFRRSFVWNFEFGHWDLFEI